MALIAAVENVFVSRDKHIDQKDMLDGISLASMLPGAVAVNVVAYVGYRLRGISGVAVSVIAVILPSFLLIILLANLYERWGEIPAVSNIFNGFIPAVSAVIVATAWNLGKKTITGWKQSALFVGAVASLILLGGFFITVGIVLFSGMIGAVFFKNTLQQEPTPKSVQSKSSQSSTVHEFIAPTLLLGVAGLSADVLFKLFVTFSGMSLMLFGGGYVFIPLIQEVVVDGYDWVTKREFIDAIAMGQITPGPILISAAFIGYKVANVGGALVATIGIFLPSIVVMVLCSRVFSKLQASILFQAALNGIRPAVVGLIAAAAILVARTAPLNWLSLTIFPLALFLLIRYRTPVAAVILPAGVAGWLAYQV